MYSDFREPGREFCLSFKLAEMLVRADICFLHYVLGLGVDSSFISRKTKAMHMNKSLVLIALLAAPVLCAAETWKDVSLVDTNCAAKVKSNPDAHTRNCALQCAKGGFGILTADGTFLKFDSQGNEQALTVLKGSQASDHLRATVTGEREGNIIKVTSATGPGATAFTVMPRPRSSLAST
jgi:hypothetical protein